MILQIEILTALCAHSRQFKQNKQVLSNSDAVDVLSKLGIILGAAQDPAFTARSILDLLVALSNFSFSWRNVPDNLQYELLITLERKAAALNPQEIANSLGALSRLGLRWNTNLPSTLKVSLLAALAKNAARIAL